MYETPESHAGPRVTAQDDPRITPFGRWLRDSKVNEFPQLWNVLVGDMSLVGPRPEDPEIVAGWPEEMRRDILSVRPGVTSPASVVYRNEEDLLRHDQVMETYITDVVPTKMRLDHLYVHNHSLWGDVDVIFWTMVVLVPRMRSYQPPELRLFQGPFTQFMRHYFSWFVKDSLVVLSAIGLTGLAWRAFEVLDVGIPGSLLFAVGFAVLFSSVNALLRANRIEWSRSSAWDAVHLIPGTLVGLTLALAANHFVSFSDMSSLPLGLKFGWHSETLFRRLFLITAAGVAFLGFLIIRYRGRLVTAVALRYIAWRKLPLVASERVLIVGGGEAGQLAAGLLNSGPSFGRFHVVGYVDDDMYKQGMRIRGVHVIGQRADIPRLVTEHDIGLVAFAIHRISDEERQAVLAICRCTQAQVIIVPDFRARFDAALVIKGGDGKINAGDLPSMTCASCAKSACVEQLDPWLTGVERALREKDFDRVAAQVGTLRRQVDASIPSAASLGSTASFHEGTSRSPVRTSLPIDARLNI